MIEDKQIKLNINYIEYSPHTKSLDIFFAGCNPPYCINCCNLELADFNNGKNWTEYKEQISNYIKEYSKLIKNIFLLGGSPNHQDMKEMKLFLSFIEKYNKSIWLFCREELECVNPLFRKYVQYIKTGEYKPELTCENNIQFGVKLATSNQNICYIGDRY